MVEGEGNEFPKEVEAVSYTHLDVYKRQSAGHEESCVNLPGPSGKAKYLSLIHI